MEKKKSKKEKKNLKKHIFLLIKVSGPVRKTSGFQTALTFKICRTSGQDMMSGRDLVLAVLIFSKELSIPFNKLPCHSLKITSSLRGGQWSSP